MHMCVKVHVCAHIWVRVHVLGYMCVCWGARMHVCIGVHAVYVLTSMCICVLRCKSVRTLGYVCMCWVRVCWGTCVHVGVHVCMCALGCVCVCVRCAHPCAVGGNRDQRLGAVLAATGTGAQEGSTGPAKSATNAGSRWE